MVTPFSIHLETHHGCKMRVFAWADGSSTRLGSETWQYEDELSFEKVAIDHRRFKR